MGELRTEKRGGKKDQGFAGELEQREPTLSMQEMYDQTFKDIVEGEIVKGKVVEIATDTVVIDIGYKSEGGIPLGEFLNPQGELMIQVGDSVDVYLQS
ncbi:MAG: S1 RNA-binding domain-containing protein, partial [candidate division NC10 bacterium]|nr:S1 RNA-binding domain-containing protein [candidate division NC10 bacterium]